MKKRIKNLDLLKLYNKSIQKWYSIHRKTENMINIEIYSVEDIKQECLTMCAFCYEKDNRQVKARIEALNREKKYIRVNCFCPAHICEFCKDDSNSLISKLNDIYDIYKLLAIIREIIEALIREKHLNCFK